MRTEPGRYPFAWAALSYLLVPAAVVALAWKGLRYRPYWRRWSERFALGIEPMSGPVIWVHAVSVGEVRSSVALVRALMQRYPRHRVLLTTMTPTGAQQVSRLFDGAVEHMYLPYDLPDVVRRFLNRIRPSLAVIAETEFWPNLFAACRRRGIPLVLANVRVSANALSGYMRVPATTRAMFACADLVCSQTRTDAQRLRSLGVPEQRLFVTGNLKFDVPVTDAVTSAGRELRQRWGAGRFVWIAGSTHGGEEERIVRVYRELQMRWSDMLLVLVPRDPERFSAVTRLVRRFDLSVARHSRTPGRLAPGVEVLVGDTMGELQTFYAAADVAFVGASLVRRGGHNILEPAAAAIPVIFGPHMTNFEDIAATVLEAGAGQQVYDEPELAAAVEFYIRNPAMRAAAGAAGRRMIALNGGSVNATLDLLSRNVHLQVAERDALQSATRLRNARLRPRN